MVARTDIYQPTMTSEGALAPAGNRGARVISPFGEAAPALAKGFSDAADVGIHMLDDDAKAWAVNASSQADIAAAELLDQKKRSAGDGAPKFKESVLTDWKKYQDDTMAAAPNDATKKYMMAHFTAVNENLTLQADDFQNQEIDRWRSKQADDGVDADSRLISTQKAEEIDNSVEKSLGKWNTYYKSLDMEPATRQKLIDATREKVTNAANMRKIQLDPTGFLAANANARNANALAGDPSAPRGLRNNNPGNLRTDAFAGTVGVDPEGYGKFETPEAGLRAMAKNLIVQQDKHGLNTVQDIITKYAPPTENNTAAYISTVAGALGVKPDEAINLKDHATLQKMMNVMIKQENGSQPYSPLQIAAGADAALNGTEVKPLNAAKPEEGGRVMTGNTAFNLGTWEQQQKWINLAETEQRRVHAERAQKAVEANVLLTSAKERMQQGLLLPDDEMQQITTTVNNVGDPKTSKKWLDLQATQTLTQSMQQLSPAQLSTVINTQLEPMAHRDGATEREALQLDIGQKLLTTMSEKVKTDPLSWGAQTGMQIQPLDFNKPESLPQRVAAAQAISEKYGVPVERAIFSQAEKTQLATSLETMPDTMKLDLGKRMQTGFGPYFTRAVGEIADKDPIFAQAAFLSGLGPQNDGLALDILRGQRALAAEPKMKPADKDKQESLAALGTAFEYMPRAVPGIIASADALYVKRVGFAENFDKDQYDRALLDVIGSTKDGKGGIGSLNGKNYLLPQQFDENDFERGLQALSADDLAAMSVGGSPPIYGKNKTPANGAEMFGDVQLRSVAYGQYAAFDKNGKAVTSEKGPNGQYILSIDPAKFAQIVAGANEKATQKNIDKVMDYGNQRGGGGIQ